MSKTELKTFDEFIEKVNLRLICDACLTVDKAIKNRSMDFYLNTVVRASISMFNDCIMLLSDNESLKLLSGVINDAVLKALVIRYTYFTHFFNDADRAMEFNSGIRGVLKKRCFDNNLFSKALNFFLETEYEEDMFYSMGESPERYDSLEQFIAKTRCKKMERNFLDTIEIVEGNLLGTVKVKERDTKQTISTLIRRCALPYANFFSDDELLSAFSRVESTQLLQMVILRLCILERLEGERKRASELKKSLKCILIKEVHELYIALTSLAEKICGIRWDDL